MMLDDGESGGFVCELSMSDGHHTGKTLTQRFSVKLKVCLPAESYEEIRLVMEGTHGARDDLQR